MCVADARKGSFDSEACFSSVLLQLCAFRYTTLSYRAPEMVNLYGGKSITTKADIWVSKKSGTVKHGTN